jgi:hypothetical protein
MIAETDHNGPTTDVEAVNKLDDMDVISDPTTMVSTTDNLPEVNSDVDVDQGTDNIASEKAVPAPQGLKHDSNETSDESIAINVDMTPEAKKNDENEKGGVPSINEDFKKPKVPEPVDYNELQIQEAEADLNDFLKSCKPKRKSVAEMLKSMPGYNKIAGMKPKIGGNAPNKNGIIELGNVKNKFSVKKEGGIQALMDRFIKHAALSGNDEQNKEQHHTVQ